MIIKNNPIIRKIRIVLIHFIRKPIFIFLVKSGLITHTRRFNPFYFLKNNEFHSDEFVHSLLKIEAKEKIINEANLILDNKFQTLGSDLVHLGEKINWHQDFKSGRIWSKDFYTKIDSKNSVNGSDIKVPWELSRFHQAQWLAKAYLITKDEKYAEKFFGLINDWIDENPFCYGVNWNCAMEVAIRAVNWIFALHIFKVSKHFTKDIEIKIYDSLFKHGIFIRNNLEYGRRNGNHFLSDLMGLIWLGAFFYNHSFGKRWFKFAKKELEKEIQIQVYDDGVDYEKSTYYQRLVTEIFLLSFLIAERINKPFSEKFKNKLHKMLKFISEYILDDEIPNIGDCDDGRILKFSFFEKVSEMRNLIAVGSVLFNDNYLKSKASKSFCDVLLLTGLDGFNNFIESSEKELKIESLAFPYGGFYILRDNNFFLFFDAGDIGMNGWGGHGHNDTLNFELAYKNKRFIVDSGTYVYTPDPEMRQKLRSTSAHNTIMVDGYEIAEFLNLFRIKEDLTNPKIVSIQLNDNEKDFIQAEHYAYTRLKNPLVVNRKIEMHRSEGQIIIIDTFTGNGPNKIEIFFHFHPQVKVNKIATSVYELSRDGLRLKIEFSQLVHYRESLEKSFYSESYGKLKENQRLRIIINKNSMLHNSFITLIKSVG